MSDILDIYVHHLSEGHQEKIEKMLPPDYLGIHEAEAAIRAPVTVIGEMELTDGILILKLAVQTEAIMPCIICNREVQVSISVPTFCHTEEIRNIKKGIFNYKEILREEILLALPSTAECNEGQCPGRAAIAKYFSNNQKKDSHPFEDL
ncbi:MAG: hypothetical protein WAM28_07740 [Chlamydiales bacterium]